MPKLTSQEKAVKFAECMRANGVPHLPDPGPKGDYNFGVVRASRLPPTVALRTA